MKRRWRIMKDYGQYKVSSDGRVITNNKFHKNSESRELAKMLCKGYLRTQLKGKNLQIHRLVALSFIPNPENKPQVNHKNGIKTDNRVENLEWCTSKENINHAFKLGLRKNQDGSKNISSKLTEDRVLRMREEFSIGGITKIDLAKKYGVSNGLVGFIIRREAWKHI